MLPRDIAAIESAAYPVHMQGMQGCESWEDVADYLEVDSPEEIIWLGETNKWYVLASRTKNGIEIADWAAMPGVTPPVFKIVLKLLRLANGKHLWCDARESTSFRVIKALERRGTIKMKVMNRWKWGGEEMVRCRMKMTTRESTLEHISHS